MDSKHDIKQEIVPKNTIDKVISYFYKHKQYNFAKSILTTVFSLRKKSNDQLFLHKMLQLIVKEYTASIFALEIGKYLENNHESSIYKYGLGKCIENNNGSIFIDCLEKWDLNESYNQWNFSVPEIFLNYVFDCKLFDIIKEEDEDDDIEFNSYDDMLGFICEEADRFLESLVKIDKLLKSSDNDSESISDLYFWDWDILDEIEKKLQQNNKWPNMQAKIAFLKNERQKLEQ